jgi:hypothetical protein
MSVDTKPPPAGANIIPVLVSGLSQRPDFFAEIFVGDDGTLLSVFIRAASFDFVIKLASRRASLVRCSVRF